MANISKMKRDEMLAFLAELKQQHTDDASIRAFNEIENHLTEKKFGLVFEEHTEAVDEMLAENIPVLTADPERRICKDASKPWNFLIEGDNLQALYLLEKTHRGTVDCIYIDPPYNTGAKDWKYNNDYVDGQDVYRHSKWLSMMKSRLLIAKRLLNPDDSVLIVTIDEKEYLHLGCLLEELFPNETIQMVSSIISPQGNQRKNQFSRHDEYIFFVQLGDSCVQKLSLTDEWRINAKDTRTTHLHWQQLIRNGDNGTRKRSPGCFYPIFVSDDGKRFLGVGEPLKDNQTKADIVPPEGALAIFPMHKNNVEGCWGCSPETLLELQKKGYVKLGRLSNGHVPINFLQKGMREKVENGDFIIEGYAEDGSIISTNEFRSFIPATQWRIPSHDASRFGSSLLKDIFIGKRFSYPKSLYAVHDSIRFFIANKPNAIVLDFFAGSGTTQHAVNLMNAEDGGNRRCIMVTNNEISADEEKRLTAEGFHKGDMKWEELGIAKYIAWPRTVCSINGTDIKGTPLKGEYITNDTNSNTIPMSQGFNCNVKYFKCNWTPRKPEDYLLSNVLCLHIREMIELQNHIEVDNVKNVLILNKSDFKRAVLNPDIYEQIEHIWVNQNIVFTAEELKLLEAKGYKYIPREFFGHELKEAAE